MFDIDEHMNNATDADVTADSYDTYIRSELNLPNPHVNTMQVVVRKRVRKNDGDHVSVLNLNTLLDASKYEVQYLGNLVE